MTLSTIEGNLNRIKEQINSSCSLVNRNPAGVRIMAVTKTVPADKIRSAVDCGIKLFGENRVQEAESKYVSIPDGVELHLIGHLQRNKARKAVKLFSCVQSIDKFETAAILGKLAAEDGKTLDVLIEVNTSEEENKFGVRDERDFFRLLESVLSLDGLRLRGLMTVGPLCEDEEKIRNAFRSLKTLFNRASEQLSLTFFDTLSMGMSGDYQIAVEEGSTMVRIGTALFGERI
ncbi:MAG: YggS family pyridoxal phosphate-dependent enzyme [Spirochaetales bacterium]|nr:YggS family pyridoxal phosphate-dependent enzyme [Spirochaetales bacterium]